MGAARVGPKTVRKESHHPRQGTPDSKRVKEEETSTRVVQMRSSVGAWGGTQGQDVGRLQPKSSQDACRELVLAESDFLQKDAHRLHPSCAEIGVGSG